MATQAHCAYCFETLAASFEKRKALTLDQVQELWTSYTSTSPSTTAITPSSSHPLFVTWNTLSSKHDKALRGCIGTFSPLPLSKGLSSYALTSAFDDTRFDPISAPELPSLQVCVTLLTDFSQPDQDVLNWEVGKHGIRLSFEDGGRRFGATYLPDVALEQGWGKEETIVSLMRKAGWRGRSVEWRGVKGLEIVRYEGRKVELDYTKWKAWRDWVDEQGS